MNVLHTMKREGFTLIEVLVVIAIAAILFAVTLVGLSGLRDETDLGLAVDDAVSFLQSARAKTLSSEGGSDYGVHFETSKFVLFKGNTYSAIDPNNIVRNVPSSIEISPITLNGGVVDLLFKRLTGETTEHGTVTLRLVNDITVMRTIAITPTGLAHIQ
jgi:prepilin-type N-terminal cleavage/methylation domain-containing protein